MRGVRTPLVSRLHCGVVASSLRGIRLSDDAYDALQERLGGDLVKRRTSLSAWVEAAVEAVLADPERAAAVDQRARELAGERKRRRPGR